ncbi:MAG: alpha-L-arabinofuranosidase C-terminal domain-containing protein, partial [Erysipelotrichaceae bacterium]
KVACQSMLINVGAPMMVTEEREVYYQTIYYPLPDVFNKAPSEVYELENKSTTIEQSKFGNVHTVNQVLTRNEDRLVMYAVNHSEDAQELQTIFIDGEALSVKRIESFTSDDIMLTNTKEKINFKEGCKKIDSTTHIPPMSWNVIYY